MFVDEFVDDIVEDEYKDFNSKNFDLNNCNSKNFDLKILTHYVRQRVR